MVRKGLKISAVFLLASFLTAFLAYAEEPPARAQKQEETVRLCIYINNAPNPVRAFGLDLIYPKDLLAFESAEKGNLLEKGFKLFGSNELSPGRVRIGAIEPGNGYIEAGASGRLVSLVFKKKKGKGEPAFKIIMVRDDMQGWSVSVSGDKGANISLSWCVGSSQAKIDNK